MSAASPTWRRATALGASMSHSHSSLLTGRPEKDRHDQRRDYQDHADGEDVAYRARQGRLERGQELLGCLRASRVGGRELRLEVRQRGRIDQRLRILLDRLDLL